MDDRCVEQGVKIPLRFGLKSIENATSSLAFKLVLSEDQNFDQDYSFSQDQINNRNITLLKSRSPTL